MFAWTQDCSCNYLPMVYDATPYVYYYA